MQGKKQNQNCSIHPNLDFQNAIILLFLSFEKKVDEISCTNYPLQSVELKGYKL